jgi:hypothetical protein
MRQQPDSQTSSKVLSMEKTGNFNIFSQNLGGKP